MNWRGIGYTQLGQLKIYSRTVRSAICLPEAERAVLLFILDRTIGWQRQWETITVAQFVRGVRRRWDGRRVTVAQGTRLDPAQIQAALQNLEELSAIEVERNGAAAEYKISEDWCHTDLRGSRMWELTENDLVHAEDVHDDDVHDMS
jgi:hypothetical protein